MVYGTMFRAIFLCLLSLLAPSATLAQVVGGCASLDPTAVARAPDLTYGEGAIRVWRVTGETGERLAVFFPPSNRTGPDICRMVGLSEDEGFRAISLEGVASTYDPATGLALEFAVTLDDTGAPLVDEGALRLLIDRARNNLTAEAFGG